MITIRANKHFYFLEDAYSKKVLLDGKTCVIEVLDTAEAVSMIKFHILYLRLRSHDAGSIQVKSFNRAQGNP